MLPVVLSALEAEGTSPSLIGLQEICRGSAGWNTTKLGKYTVVSYRDEEAWRGVGILYDSKQWSVMRKKCSPHGIWCRMRHFDSQQEVWMGSIYIAPQFTAADVATKVEAHLQVLPATMLPCMLAGDTNAGIRWNSTGDSVIAVGTDGKGRVLFDTLLAAGFELTPPKEEQLSQPTSRPRRDDATGRIIDWVACKRVCKGRVTIQTDSHAQFGTDHDALVLPFVIHTSNRPTRRIQLGPRVVTKPLGEDDASNLDYDKLCQLAKERTGPLPSSGYKDDVVVRELFRIAKRSRSGHAWTRALRARREAHHRWREDQVKAATSGDWGAFRACKKTKHAGWEIHLADALQPQDPHQAVHDHYSSIFRGPGCADLPPLPAPPPSPDFSTEEIEVALTKGHKGKSVGQDGISLELLKAIAVAARKLLHLG